MSSDNIDIPMTENATETQDVSEAKTPIEAENPVELETPTEMENSDIMENDTETENSIIIEVEPQFLPQHSQPDDNKFAFAYTITITNNCSDACQLLARHWIITDANEQIQEVQGAGVVGEQPRLVPGASFTYASGAILKTEWGTMKGSYQMRSDAGEIFDVPISEFALVPAHALH